LTLFDAAGNAQSLEPLDVTLARDSGAQCPSEAGDCAVAWGADQPRIAGVSLLGGLFALFVRRRRRPPRRLPRLVLTGSCDVPRPSQGAANGS
jgi:MYXO-CTERM domain-containing protein